MESMHYIGMDIHKKIIAFCIKTFSGRVIKQGKLPATRKALSNWLENLPQPWTAAMEATLFTAWIYDFLKPYAQSIKVAHPEMLKAITAAKKKNDVSDAEKIANLLRVDMLPECYMMPQELRDLRRRLRYRNHIVRTATKEKNKISGLLMEVGAQYNKKRLHGKKYFFELLDTVEDVPDSVISMLKLSRSNLEIFTDIQKRLVHSIKGNPLIRGRVERLLSIRGVGEVTALTWVLEIGEPERFHSIRQAISFCGLCAAQKESAGKEYRGPISKKRNKHLQTILIEAAKLAPIWNPQLSEIHQKELARGNKNRATLAVARKLVAYMLAVDKSGQAFQVKEPEMAA
nr:IS110 family transposase [uncultured Desulfobacter sp.]